LSTIFSPIYPKTTTHSSIWFEVRWMPPSVSFISYPIKSKVVTRGRSTNSFSSVWMKLLCMDHEPVMSCCTSATTHYRREPYTPTYRHRRTTATPRSSEWLQRRACTQNCLLILAF
jgi:hypothetical protein